MAVRSRRGQIFLIGMILFAALLTGIVLLDQGAFFLFSGSEVPKEVFEQSVEEYPETLNSIIRSDSDPEEIKREVSTYLGFQSYTATSHAIETRQHTVILIPDSTGLTAIAGNFRGTDLQEVNLTVAGDTENLGTLKEEEVTATGFSPATESFSVKFNATGRSYIENEFNASMDGSNALYSVRIEGENQVWQTIETY